jgi:hypothetical protein
MFQRHVITLKLECVHGKVATKKNSMILRPTALQCCRANLTLDFLILASRIKCTIFSQTSHCLQVILFTWSLELCCIAA